MHFALSELPELTGPNAVLNEGQLRSTLCLFGTPEEMQRDYEACLRGEVPDAPPVSLGIPSLLDPSLAPEGRHAASAFAFYAPIGVGHEDKVRLRDEMAERIVERIAAVAPNFPDSIERQISYPAYSYELMFGCTGGDFTHALLHPELMGPFRPGPRGWPDNAVPVRRPLPVRRRLPRRPGRHLHPRLQRRLRRARRRRIAPAGSSRRPSGGREGPVVAHLALDHGQVGGHREARSW